MTALSRKLFREIWRLRGQTAAIAIVVAGGIATWIIGFSTMDSLKVTRDAFYREARFAEIFASAKRAPNHLEPRITTLPGVARAQTRVIAGATMELAGFRDPVSARLVSIPDHGEPELNRLHLRAGRMPEHRSGKEIVASEAFTDAHDLELGQSIDAVINGRRRELTIVGIALSPEFIYQIQPGGLFPDHQRFGVFWIRRHPLSTAFDMEGGFNNVTLTLERGARPEPVIERLDNLLDRYGGTGAYTRNDQLSHEYLQAEITQLENLVGIVPVIFLGVAAFLLNVVMTRVIQQQRDQIAVLKAFGYTNRTVSLHYVGLVMVMMMAGTIPGILFGAWAGNGMAEIYGQFFRFPYLHYHLSPMVVLSAVGISAAAGLIGTLRAVREAAKLPPAEAMRPEPPPTYRPTLVERWGLQRWLDQPTRMIFRRLERRPLKSFLAILGIGMSGGLILTSSFQEDAISHMVHVQFSLAHREDLTATFTEPVELDALYEIRSLPGVMRAEPFRSVPVRLRAGHRSRRIGIQATEPGMDLHRTLDQTLDPIELPAGGLLLSQFLADELHLESGDPVTVEVLEGAQPVREVRVAGTVTEYIGLSGYMQLDALNGLMREGPLISGAYLQIDQEYKSEIIRELKDRPRVAGVTIREVALQNFYETMGDTLLIFAFVNTLLAGSIAFGVIYNSARISFSERARELASLRVLGFTRGEVSYILHGELAVLALLAVPAGLWIGRQFARLIAESLASDLYRVPLIINDSSYAFSATVIVVSAVLSGLLLQRRLNRLDMVSVLKTRE